MPVPPSYIKNVALEIDCAYSLDNTPFPVNEYSDLKSQKSNSKTIKKTIPFIGRKQHILKFLEFLLTPKKNGVFLVTGYRGMGKTSFVNHVLTKYQHKFNSYDRKKIKIIHLTLAQNQPTEIDILRLMVSSVFDQYKMHLSDQPTNLFKDLKKRHLLKLLILPLIVLFAPIVAFHSGGTVSFLSVDKNWFNWTNPSSLYTSLILVLFIVYVFAFLKNSYSIYRYKNEDSAFNRISKLVDRSYSALSEENTYGEEAGIAAINIKLSGGEKRTKQYPIASTKEMEYELQSFLDKVKHELDFIFVFDELDKLDPPLPPTTLYKENEVFGNPKLEYERSLRDRKQAITNIITGLKNLLTTASAKFIFIAGREMFDASLADISDRQSQISSIFTYVFNIESLLKEKYLTEHSSTTPASLSFGIEEYLKYLLFDNQDGENDKESLYELARNRYIRKEHPELFDKLYFILQNFVTYLTYRTNGSPKKLIREIQEFIRAGKKNDIFNSENTTIYKQTREDSALYLFFSYNSQYHIGFINYLYRPFLIRFGRSHKLFSDNIIVSTSYLFDHLLKFHPFAFSMTHLELVPENLSVNRTPYLREHIRKIIDYLGGSHIRDIEIGLFDFKFYSRTLNEISFLSKISEQEAAAFNYTLDESYLVKIHILNKIKELQDTYSKFSDSGRHISSISHLHEILGDLHFFDQEYDDTIVAYEDAIRSLKEELPTSLSMEEFVLLLQNRLKLGLCFEKISSYSKALSRYAETCESSLAFIESNLKKRDAFPIEEKCIKVSKEEKRTDLTIPRSAKVALIEPSAISDILQIILQGFICQMYLQEKKSVAGISELKVFMTLGAFLQATNCLYDGTHRNHVIKANAFLHTGNLLYFKNSERSPKYASGYHLALPCPFKADITRLITWDKKYYLLSTEEAKKKNTLWPSTKDHQKPLLGLFMYLMGLNEIMSFKDSDHPLFWYFRCKNPFQGILKKLNIASAQPANEEMYRAIYYNYNAMLIPILAIVY
jgi:hypothetical protein